jgi:hypothetical protein
VLDGVSSFIEHRLKLRVNADKSAVGQGGQAGTPGLLLLSSQG